MLNREDILRRLSGLEFLGPDCWLTSGAALVLYGVKEQTRDIDLICTTALADRLEARGVPFRRSSRDDTRVFAYSQEIEILENWRTDQVIQLDGLPVASLKDIRRQKEELGREKDWADIRLIDKFLERQEKKKMFAVAIDGPAGAGKSSVAKAAARELGFVYVDTGALYRTIGLYLLDRGVDPKDAAAVEPLLPQIRVELSHTPEGQKMFLNGEDVTDKIRTPEVSMAASDCSAIPAVRAALLELQRDLAQKNNVLMDGRDIGTVVLPDAPLKVFYTASAEERARRRVKQLLDSGRPADYDTVLEDIRQRDWQDSHREIAPLKQGPDAVLLDTTELTIEEATAKLIELVRERQ